MEGGDNDDYGKLMVVERTTVTTVTAVLFRCQVERAMGRMKAQIRAQRRKVMQCTGVEGLDTAAIYDAVVQVWCALGCGVLPKATPRWWIKRRAGGVWEDLRQCDDATEDYFRQAEHAATCLPGEIVEALLPFMHRPVTFYAEPLQPDHIVAYALYRWALEEMYESSAYNFCIGRASGLVPVRDVTAALLTVYREKISWPTGLRKSVVLYAFASKGFPNCHVYIDCTHIYIDKLANALGEDYYVLDHRTDCRRFELACAGHVHQLS
ncbi:hypothetical protein CBR_g38818 [Chara braunii]|uniref:DDE Tnp4 domain-containing protein n=1 Tax=Chara braunii TaxID=69332 RepID=A0A388LQC8_CHABU|nr:hypothetical protein CBR_g38818 [Chara braunii]|eukprot:GBG84536.1 hypothetical protein CBR_g38818 [Chara braunii]